MSIDSRIKRLRQLEALHQSGNLHAEDAVEWEEDV